MVNYGRAREIESTPIDLIAVQPSELSQSCQWCPSMLPQFRNERQSLKKKLSSFDLRDSGPLPSC